MRVSVCKLAYSGKMMTAMKWDVGGIDFFSTFDKAVIRGKGFMSVVI